MASTSRSGLLLLDALLIPTLFLLSAKIGSLFAPAVRILKQHLLVRWEAVSHDDAALTRHSAGKGQTTALLVLVRVALYL
jgi:hypothetical protein